MLEFSCSAPCDSSDTLVVVDERHTKRVGGVAQKKKEKPRFSSVALLLLAAWENLFRLVTKHSVWGERNY